MVVLIVRSGPLEGTRLEVDREVTLGREDADLVLDDAEVSRRHAAVRPAEGGVEVEDLGSRNGTRVDGIRITETVIVGDGALVRVGQVTLGVVVEVEEEVDPGATRISQVPDETVIAEAVPDPSSAATQLGDSVPAPAARAPATERVAAAPAPRTAPAPVAPPTYRETPVAPAQPFGSYQPGTRRRTRKAATRYVTGQIFTYLAVTGTAAGLIYYFVERN